MNAIENDQISSSDSIRSVARKHCEQVILPQVKAWEATTIYPRQAANTAASDGLLGLYCPIDLGGQALSFSDAIPVYEELGRGAGLYSFSLSMHNIVSYAISSFGQASLSNEWTERLTSGEALDARGGSRRERKEG